MHDCTIYFVYLGQNCHYPGFCVLVFPFFIVKLCPRVPSFQFLPVWFFFFPSFQCFSVLCLICPFPGLLYLYLIPSLVCFVYSLCSPSCLFQFVPSSPVMPPCVSHPCHLQCLPVVCFWFFCSSLFSLICTFAFVCTLFQLLFVAILFVLVARLHLSGFHSALFKAHF